MAYVIDFGVTLIGASLSEPHTSESNSAIVSIYYIIIIVRTPTESKSKILILHYVCEAYATALNNFVCARADRMEATGSLQAQYAKVRQSKLVFMLLTWRRSARQW